MSTCRFCFRPIHLHNEVVWRHDNNNSRPCSGNATFATPQEGR